MNLHWAPNASIFLVVSSSNLLSPSSWSASFPVLPLMMEVGTYNFKMIWFRTLIQNLTQKKQESSPKPSLQMANACLILLFLSLRLRHHLHIVFVIVFLLGSCKGWGHTPGFGSHCDMMIFTRKTMTLLMMMMMNKLMILKDRPWRTKLTKQSFCSDLSDFFSFSACLIFRNGWRVDGTGNIG